MTGISFNIYIFFGPAGLCGIGVNTVFWLQVMSDERPHPPPPPQQQQQQQRMDEDDGEAVWQGEDVEEGVGAGKD